MFSLTISFGPQGAPWVLMWKSEEPAKKAYDCVVTTRPLESVELVDDFGQTCRIWGDSIHGVMLENLELSKLAHIERALHQARMQAKGQEAAENDQVLKAARFRSGPGVITPMGGPNGAYGRG